MDLRRNHFIGARQTAHQFCAKEFLFTCFDANPVMPDATREL